jgi:hypothetical protein
MDSTCPPCFLQCPPDLNLTLHVLSLELSSPKTLHKLCRLSTLLSPSRQARCSTLSAGAWAMACVFCLWRWSLVLGRWLVCIVACMLSTRKPKFTHSFLVPSALGFETFPSYCFASIISSQMWMLPMHHFSDHLHLRIVLPERG